jgi:hypothetical protein
MLVSGKYGYMSYIGGAGHQVEASACKSCPPGTVSNPDRPAVTKDLSEGCSLCDPGYYGTEIGLTKGCNGECKKGRYASESVATKLPPNKTIGDSPVKKYLAIARSYEESCNNFCPSGRYGFSDHAKTVDDGCKKCPPGKFEKAPGQEKCSGKCSLGTYGGSDIKKESISQNNTCPNLCPAGRFGYNEGKATKEDACRECDLGQFQPSRGHSTCFACEANKYSDEYGKSECKRCPGTRENRQLCYGHGTCGQTTGKCTCTPKTGWIPAKGCKDCEGSSWDSTNPKCDTCVGNYVPFLVKGKLQCLQPCQDQQLHIVDSKTGAVGCPMSFKSIIVSIISIFGGIVGFCILIYKIFLFYVFKKSGKLKKEFHNINGFFLVLAFGKKGNHMVSYENNIQVGKGRRRKSKKKLDRRRKSSLVEMPDTVFDGIDDDRNRRHSQRKGSYYHDSDEDHERASNKSNSKRSRRKTYDGESRINIKKYPSRQNRKGGRLTFSEDRPKKDDSLKPIKKVKSILKKSSLRFNSDVVKNNKNISFSTDVNITNGDNNIDDNNVKVSINEIVSAGGGNGNGGIRFAMPKKESASEQYEEQVTIKEEESNRRTESQQGAMKPIKMENKKKPEKSMASNSSKRSRASNISIEDLLYKLNMLQYMDDLVNMGCDTIENAVFANVDDLVTDGQMKKIHAKVFIKAAKKIMEKQCSKSSRRRKGGT